MSDPVVVIGAGIAGLTAAYQLKQAGRDVLVLESNDHVGGRMTTVEWEGFKVDSGAKFVTTADKHILEMLRAVGLEDQLIKSDDGLTIAIYRDGKIHAANFLSIPSYLGWSGVSLGARLAMLKLLPYLLRTRLDNVYHLERVPGPDVSETFEDFFYKHISPEMFEYWASPMFETMCAYTGKDVSRKAFLAMLVGYLNADTVSFRDGAGVLPEALASRFNVELSARVESIQLLADGSGARVNYTQNGSNHFISAQQVIVAVPGIQVLQLFEAPRPAWQQYFPKVGYSMGALHYHIVESDYEPPVKATFVPRSLKLPVNSVTFEQHKDGRWLLLTDPSISSFSMDKPNAALEQEAMQVAALLFPALEGKFTAHRLFRWAQKVPTFRPGYLDALAAFWQNPQEGPIFFCGDYFAGPSTGGASYSGRECVERLLKANP